MDIARNIMARSASATRAAAKSWTARSKLGSQSEGSGIRGVIAKASAEGIGDSGTHSDQQQRQEDVHPTREEKVAESS